jgi:replicative DNA helicase
MGNENNQKLPPQNEDVEKSLLGCLMIDPTAIIKVADNLDEKDFYQRKNKEIYSVISEFFDKGEAIDFLTVSNRLKEKGKQDMVGGRSYLTEIVNSVPTSGNVETYAKIVRRKGVLRDLIDASHSIGSIVHTREDEDTDIILDEAEKTIFDIAQRSLKQRFYSVKEGLGEAQARLERLSKSDGSIRGVSTGFTALDNKLAGLQKSDLVVLAARPSMGKSSLALNIALNAAMNVGAPVGVFSLEMGKEQLVDRFISTQARVDLWKLRTGRLDKEEGSRVQTAMGELSDVPIYIDDTSGINVLQMKAMARRLQAQNGLGLIIVDYLQLITPRNSSQAIVQQMTEISRALKCFS